MKKNKLIIYIFVIILIVSLLGCNSKFNNKESAINIILEENDTEEFEKVKKIVHKFNDSSDKYKVNLLIEKDINKFQSKILDKEIDLIISGRRNFIKLNKEGLTKDLTSYFNQNKSQEKFYNIIYSYGKIGDKFYGMGMLPYSIEMVINKELLHNIKENDEIVDLKKIIKILVNNNKIPVILPKEISTELALSSIIGNNLIKDTYLLNVYEGEKTKYGKAEDIQNIFNVLGEMVREYGLKEDSFYKGKEEDLDKINNGEISLALITSRVGKNKDYPNIEVIDGVNIENYKVTPPVVINYIVYAMSSSENIEGINKFLDYIVTDQTYVELIEEGFLTGNKKADTLSKGLNSKLLWTISQGGITNIPYYLNLPDKFISPLNKTLTHILSNGECKGNEWNEIIDKLYK